MQRQSPGSSIWAWLHDWVFADVAAGLQGIQSGSVTWADFDNYGRLDLLLTGLNNVGTPGRWLYRNGTVLGSASAPRLLPLKRFAIGGYQIAFEGQRGFGYRVWASTNLVQWTALGAANEGSPATFQFSDRQAANLPSRSYRVSRP